LEKGETEDKIVAKFDGDNQLVQLWIAFLHHNHFMKQTGQAINDWEITDKGAAWLKQYNMDRL
jgi:predicted transcriptional regulator